MSEWGPLQHMIGVWEGNDGLDVSFHNADQVVGETGYFERAEFKAFGPVDNGKQVLFGLDYRMAAWRHGEEALNPFHTEVGYWLWDAAAGQVMRCFMVPRGVTILAGATAAPTDRTFTLQATLGDPTYGVLENKYLAGAASTVRYECSVRIEDDGTLSYESDTVVNLRAIGGELHHTDRNRLTKVRDA